nr:hypothetical protein [Stigmatella hybrida]
MRLDLAFAVEVAHAGLLGACHVGRAVDEVLDTGLDGQVGDCLTNASRP